LGKKRASGNVRTTATSETGDRLHIRIPPDFKEVLREMAEEDDRTISNLVLKVLRDEAKRRGKPS